MKRWLVGLLGLTMLTIGAHLIISGQPDEGEYRYPRAARDEARSFSRTIKDAEARQRFLEETTGRTKIHHPLELFLGGTLGAAGIAAALIALKWPQQRPPAPPAQRAA